MSAERATAVVVTYNSAAHIGTTLAALRGGASDIVVVDNASTDDTTTIVRLDAPDVTLIANGVNVGFAAAVNQALATVRNPIVLLVNPDCTVPAATSRGLVRFLIDEPGAAIAGPRLVDPAGRVAISAHPFESLSSVVLSRFGGSLVPVGVRRIVSRSKRRAAYDACRSSVEPVAVEWLSGACLAVRADVLRTVGGLDERYFLYYEDEELCWQAHRLGRHVFYVPGLTATHVGGASSETGATWPHLYRSMLVFFASHRRSSYQAVRGVVLLRAGLGVAMGAARRAVGGRGGSARVLAWRRVAGIAWTSSRLELAEVVP